MTTVAAHHTVCDGARQGVADLDRRQQLGLDLAAGFVLPAQYAAGTVEQMPTCRLQRRQGRQAVGQRRSWHFDQQGCDAAAAAVAHCRAEGQMGYVVGVVLQWRHIHLAGGGVVHRTQSLHFTGGDSRGDEAADVGGAPVRLQQYPPIAVHQPESLPVGLAAQQVAQFFRDPVRGGRVVGPGCGQHRLQPAAIRGGAQRHRVVFEFAGERAGGDGQLTGGVVDGFVGHRGAHQADADEAGQEGRQQGDQGEAGEQPGVDGRRQPAGPWMVVGHGAGRWSRNMRTVLLPMPPASNSGRVSTPHETKRGRTVVRPLVVSSAESAGGGSP